MSQFYSGYCGDVLYLTADEFDGFSSKFAEINNIEPDDVGYTVADREPLVDFAGDELELVELNEGWCDSVFFVGYGEEDGWEPIDNNVFLLFAKRQRNPFTQAYKDVDELKAEYKRKLFMYLPADFDWDAHMGWVQYAVYA